MKNRYFKAYVLLISILMSGCEDVPEIGQAEGEPVVEAYLYAGEPIDDIVLKRSRPFSSTSGSEDTETFITDANILIISQGVDYPLSPNPEEPGHYFYPGDDLEIEIGQSYGLAFDYEDESISSETTIPSRPTGGAISRDNITIPQINDFSELRNFRDSFEETIDISWDNDNADFYYLVIENIEENPESIDPTDVLGGLGINFEFITEPTQLDVFSLRVLVHYSQYGLHRVTLYHVNEEYARLYESTTQDSRDLNEPFTNITNGLGVFTGFSSEQFFFEVIQE